MRELTKSMMSFSWAMSMFGLRRMGDLLLPQSGWNQAAASFDAITRTAREQLGAAAGSTFQAGDDLQRQAVDLVAGMFDMDSWNPARLLQMGTDALQRSVQAGSTALKSSAAAVSGATAGCGCGSQPSAKPKGGWGPMP
jgi:hypothetical protein